MNTRYSRHIALSEIGETGQQKLLNARVLVIGAGGLGCPVLQQLAAAGIGTIGIVDGDQVDVTNLHRQVLYTQDDCGKNKTVTAAKVLQKLNPDCSSLVFDEFFTANNANTITTHFDLIVDCTDSLPVRYLINDIAVVKNLPVVYASIHKFEGQVSVFNYQNGPSYRCLFPEDENKKDAPNCVTSGVLSVIPNLIGMYQATEVFKIILEIGEVLSGKVLLVNALTNQTQVFRFAKNDKAITIGKTKGVKLLEPTNNHVYELNQTAFLNKLKNSDCVIVDVRELSEMPKLTSKKYINLPLKIFETAIEQFTFDTEMVICCQSGKRSELALEIAKKKGFTKVAHLKNGIQSLNFN